MPIPSRFKALIVVEDGCVVDVYSNVALEWEVADYDVLTDVEGYTSDEATKFVEKRIDEFVGPDDAR